LSARKFLGEIFSRDGFVMREGDFVQEEISIDKFLLVKGENFPQVKEADFPLLFEIDQKLIEKKNSFFQLKLERNFET